MKSTPHEASRLVRARDVQTKKTSGWKTRRQKGRTLSKHLSWRSRERNSRRALSERAWNRKSHVVASGNIVLQNKWGSRRFASEKCYTLSGGTQTLTEKLTSKLKEDYLRCLRKHEKERLQGS